MAASLTTPTGPAGGGDGDDAAGLGLLRAADRLGQRQVVGHGEGTAGEVAGHQRRQPAPDPGRAIAAIAPVQRNSAITNEQHVVEQRGRHVEDAPWHSGQPSTSDGDARGRPSRPRWCPVSRRRSSRHTIALSTRPPSSGRPGHQVEQADQQVGPGEALDREQQQPVGRDEPQRRPRARADRQRRERPDDRDPELLARGARLTLDRGHATEEVQRDRVRPRTRSAAGHQACEASCSSTDEVEDDREGQPDDVLPAAETGLDLLDPGRHHEGDQGRDQEPRRR